MTSNYCQIKDLTLNAHSFYLNTLIIAKTEKKLMQTARNSAVITFTVRDTKDHFINCSVWGTNQYIETCARTYKIGDIISIFKPTVQQKNTGSIYHPRTTSPFELQVTEGKSYIHRANEQAAHLIQLQRQTFKPTSQALKLNDLNFSPDSDACTVDVVVLVRAVEPARQVQTKFGSRTTRKVYLMDTTMESITMTIWHPDYQERMEEWKPLETILHLVDVRAEYSDFERSTQLSITSKTIIIENPVNSSRSNEILLYLHTMDQATFDELKSNQQKSMIDAASIKEVMTVKRILDGIDRDPNKEIAAIVYGVITRFDLNGALVKCCVQCKRLVRRNRSDCGTASCEGIETNGPQFIDKVFMPVSVCDHTGTLNCRIIDENAQAVLGYTAQQLKELPEDYVDAMFNKFILMRFAVKMIIRSKSQNDYFASILSITAQPSDQVAQALKP